MFTIIFSSNSAWSLWNFRQGVISAVLAKGYRVIAIAPEDDSSENLRSLGCEVYSVSIDNRGTNPFHDLKTLLQYSSLYKKLKPDVVLHFTVKPVIYGTFAAWRQKIPCINMITGLGTAFNKENLLTKIVVFLYRYSQRWPERILFQNRDDMQLFLKRKIVAKKKEMLLPGSGINLSEFRTVALKKRKYPVFILIARMLWDKGVGVYVDAARIVKEMYPQTKFQILGPLAVDNKTAISAKTMDTWVAEGLVEYLGQTKDVRPFIANSDCVVLPSFYREGVPHSLLEAAAMARPIITTDSIGCKEAVDNKVSGYLCKIKNSNDLADKMKKFIELPYESKLRMGKKGRKKMEKEFDEKIVIHNYLKLIDEIQKKKTGSKRDKKV